MPTLTPPCTTDRWSFLDNELRWGLGFVKECLDRKSGDPTPDEIRRATRTLRNLKLPRMDDSRPKSRPGKLALAIRCNCPRTELVLMEDK